MGGEKDAIKKKLIQEKILIKSRNLRGKEKQEWEQYLLCNENEKQMRLEASEARENLWRWREEGGRRLKGEEKMRKSYIIEEKEIMENRIKRLGIIMENVKRKGWRNRENKKYSGKKREQPWRKKRKGGE